MPLADKIQEASSVILYKYWNELREQRRAPHRFEIEPSQIAGILSQTFIIESDASDNYNFRLAGTKICQEFCQELKHTNLLALWSDNDRLTIENMLQSVTQNAGIGVVEFMAAAENGRTVDYEMIILPLYHNDYAITRMLGSMSAKTQPYWLGISPLQGFSLKAVRLFWPEDLERQTQDEQDSTSNVTPLTSTNYKVVVSKERKFRVYEGGSKTSPQD